LLIGGGSGVGKTYLAKKLSEYYKCPYLKIDNLRYFIQNVLKEKSSEFPELFSNIDSKDDNISNNNFKIAKFIKPGLKALIDKYIQYGETPAMIIEGIELLPQTLEFTPSDKLKGIFLYDTLDSLAKKMVVRNRDKLTKEEYYEKAKDSIDFINTVIKEADKTGFSKLQSSPEEILVDRAIELLK
jgi:2-phosphoglycerate kinase